MFHLCVHTHTPWSCLGFFHSIWRPPSYIYKGILTVSFLAQVTSSSPLSYSSTSSLHNYICILIIAANHSPLILLLFSSFALAIAGKHHGPSGLLRPAIGFGKEKMSHLHFYFHDIVSGRNPTAVLVADAKMSSKSPTGFGSVMMMDDPLTEGPEPTSKQLGRAQGLYGSASQDTLGLLMAMNFAFVDGKYNGSTLSVLGRNSVFSEVREMPVVGGSGLFRFARGYALAHTHWVDIKTGDAIVEYNVYVMHY